MGFSISWFVIGLACGLLLLLAQFFNRKALVLSLAAIVLMNLIGLPRNWLGNEIYQWLNPLQVNRTSFIAGLIPTILVGARALLPIPLLGSMPAALIILMANYIYIGMLRGMRIGPIDGVLTIGLSVVTITTIWTLVHRLTEDWEDFVIVPRAIAMAMAGFLGLTAVQWVVNPDRITTGNTDRFIGVASNPQFVAVLFGIGLVMVIWLALYDKRRYLLAYIALAVPSGVALLASGSRTGLMMCLLGLCFLGVRRFGRMILVLPVLGFVLILIVRLAGAIGLDLPFDRFLAGGDTRTVAWQTLIRQFMSNPAIGVGQEQAGYSENSFLLAAAAYGIPCVLMLVAFALTCGTMVLRTFRQTLPWKSLASQNDLIVGTMAAYFAGTILEGYLVGRVNATLVLIAAVIAAAKVLGDRVTSLNEEYAWQDHEEPQPEPEAEAAASW